MSSFCQTKKGMTMQSGHCSVCEKRKGKRACPALGGKSICPECCVSRRGAPCGNCEHYVAAMRLAVDRYRTTGKHPFSINTTHEDDIADVLEELADMGDTEKALEALEQYADDTSPYYLYALGVVCSTNDENEHASEYYLSAIMEFPFFAHAWYNLSSSLLADGYSSFAYDACHIAMNLMPPTHHLHIKAKEQLRDMADRYARSDPLFSLAATMIRRRTLIGYENMIISDPRRAANGFQKMLAEEPHTVQLHNNLGVCYIHMRRKDDAIREFQTALDLDPDDDIARANLRSIKNTPADAPQTETPGMIIDSYGDFRQTLIRKAAANPLHSETIRMLFALYCPAPPAD